MARPRSEEAQAKVLKAAVELVAEVGVSGFTVDAVATKSGVAKTTIYRRWSSADELLMAALEESIAPLPTPNTGSLRQDLIELYTMIMKMLDEPGMFRTMLGVVARSANDPEFKRLKSGLEHERHQPLRTVVQLALARGEITTDVDIEIIMDFVEGPMAARKMMKLGSFSAEEIEEVVDLIVAGLTA